MGEAQQQPVEELSPAQVKSLLDRGQITLIDVREPNEYASERIPGALLFPLSTFDPRYLPPSGMRRVVFHCGSGKRSAAAVRQQRAADASPSAHLAGGIAAWKAAGLPVIRGDAATAKAPGT
jgi:rhodanese-related sulfurtransferase